MALQDTFDSSGVGLEPQALQRRRELAAVLMQQGQDYSPVKSWTQAAARIADSLVGSMQMRSADAQERASRQGAITGDKAALLQALTGGGASPASTPPSPGAAPAAAPGTPMPAPGTSAGSSPSDTLFAALKQQESGNNPNAIGSVGESSAAQVMPTTLTDPGFGVKPLDPAAPNAEAEKERVGKDYLAAMLKRYGGNQDLGLAAYNAGPGNVDKGIIPASTKAYVSAIDKRAGQQPMALGPSPAPTQGAQSAVPGQPMPTTQVAQSAAPGAPGGNNMAALLGVINNPWSPPGDKALAQAILERNPQLFPEKPISVAPGATLIDPVSHKVVYSSPEKPPAGYEANPKGGLEYIPGGPGDPKTAAAKTQAQTDALAESDIIQDQKTGIEKGLIPPPTRSGGYGKYPAALKGALAKDKFDLTKATLQYDAADKQVKAIGPQMLKYRGLAQSVVNTIDHVTQAAKELKQGGVPIVNYAKLTAYINAQGNSEMGKKASKYLADIGVVKEEVANLAAGGYAPTDAAWTLANTLVNGDYGSDQLISTLGEVQTLINFRSTALEQQYPFSTGGSNPYLPPGAGAVPAPGGGAAPGGPPSKVLNFDAQGNQIQ